MGQIKNYYIDKEPKGFSDHELELLEKYIQDDEFSPCCDAPMINGRCMDCKENCK